MATDAWDWTGGNYDAGPEPLRIEPTQSTPFAGYLLEALIGRGGMGAVYRARRADGVAVALKTLRSDRGSEAHAHRFQREVQIQSELGEHPHVVTIVDPGGEADGLLYFAMELAPGGSLDAVCQGLELRERVRLLAQAARGVGFGHRRGYLHRDLKPQNILIDGKGDALVTDFGLAKSVEQATQLTKTGTMLGTPLYMSPEHFGGGQERLGTQSDVFSLGAILYQLATDQLPFMANNATNLMILIAGSAPPSFAAQGLRLPELEAVALKALRKEPGLRYRDADAFADDLEAYLEGRPVSAGQGDLPERLALWFQRQWPLVLCLIILLLLAIAVTVELKRPSPDEADAQARDLARPQRLLEVDLGPAAGDGEQERAVAAAFEVIAAGGTAAEVDPTLLPGLLNRLRALRAERRPASAKRALTVLERLPPAADPLEVARLRVRLRAQLASPPTEAVEALRRLDPRDPLVLVWDGRRLLWSDEPSRALQLLEEALKAPGEERGPLLALRAAAVDALGRSDEALQLVAAINAADLSPREALTLFLSHDTPLLAVPFLRQLASQTPLPLADAQWISRTCQASGRPHLARDLLAEALGRADDAGLALELLRARALLGEKVDLALADLDAPDALLLRADLACAAEGPQAYLQLSEQALTLPAARAARLRALASVDPAAARAERVALEALLEEGAADELRSPMEDRLARDLRWARHLLGEPALPAKSIADRAAEAVDFDWRLLPSGAEGGVAGAFRREATLDGPLARGLVLTRAGQRWGSPELMAEGRLLLELACAGRPALLPLRLSPEDEIPSPWAAVCTAELRAPSAPFLVERERALLFRERALELASDDPRRQGLLRQALAGGDLLAGEHALLAEWPPKTRDDIRAWIDALRAQPHAALRVICAFPPMHRLPNLDSTADNGLTKNVVAFSGWYRSRLIMKVDAWREEGRGLIEVLDALIKGDPALIGLLYPRAHIARLLGDVERSERDLAVLARLPQVHESDAFWSSLYRVWILSRDAPGAALDLLPAPWDLLPYERAVFEAWFRGYPGPSGLRKNDAFGRWIESVGGRETPAPLEAGPNPGVVLRLEFEERLDGTPGGPPLRAAGVTPGQGRRGAGAHIGARGGLVYPGAALDPREGTFMAWVQPDWKSSDVRKDPDAQNRWLFAWQPRPWKQELRVWVWRERLLSTRVHAGQDEPVRAFARRPLEQSKWTHVATTWSASAGALTLYLNGRVQSVQRGFRAPSASSPAPPIVIGCNPEGLDESWGGTIDDVVLLDRALSAEEIAAAQRE